MEFDILSLDEKTTTIKAEANRISSRKNQKIQRHGVRRFENGRIFQTSRLGTANKDRLISDTKEWGGEGINHEFGFAPAHKEHRNSTGFNENVLLEYEQGLSYLSTQFPEYNFSGQCAVSAVKTSLQSSYGLDLSSSGTVCEWYYLYQKRGSGNMLDGYFGETTATPKVTEAIKEHTEFLQRQGQLVNLKSGKMPVLLVEGMAPLKKLIEAFHINKYLDGASLYSGKMGQKLFDEKVSIFDCGYDQSSGHILFFDGEGSLRELELNLVENGNFVANICDLRFAKKYGSKTTSNGVRAYNRGVSLGFNSLRVKKQKKSWRSIIKELDRCLVALVAVGGDSNDLGEYSTPIQIGYVFEKGEIVGQAPQVTIKTSINDYLSKGLIDVSSDGFTRDATSACIISEMDVLVN